MLRAKIFDGGIAIAACLAIAASPAWAQSGGGRGGGGSSFGQSGFGSGAGSGLGGSGGFGSGTNGFSGFGGSAFGNSSSFGGNFGNTFGSNGFGSSNGFGNLGGGQGFGGQQGMNGAQGGQNFIGRSGSDMQSMMKAMGQGSNQFFQQLNRTLGQANRGRQNNQQKENAELPVRVRLNVAFDGPAPQRADLAATVHEHVDKILAVRNIAAPNIEVDGDTVVLSGTAASDDQRLVIEKLVSLEPGVSQVLNQMTVAGSSPAETMPQRADN
jgi:hypothetical protein